MPAKRSATNLFYALLVVLGIAFTLTACAYCVMALKSVRPQTEQQAAGGESLLDFLDRHGAALMAGELAALAAATFAAIATDRYWMRRAYRQHQENQAKQQPPASRDRPP